MRPLCLTVLAIILLVPGAFGQSSPSPSPEAVARGIAAYEVMDIETARSVILKDAEGAELARLLVSYDTQGGEHYELTTPDGARIVLAFDEVSGTLQGGG